MKVLDPGHYFHLNVLDAESDCTGETLRFVKREGPGYPGNVGHHGGTTMQEVLRALISRAEYVNNQIPDSGTEKAIYHMTQAVYHLEVRAALRHGRLIDFTPYEAVTGTTCPKCGHVNCGGACSTKHNNTASIILNGRKLDIENRGTLSYDDIVALVLQNDLVGSDMKVAASFGALFTITYSDFFHRAGSVCRGEAIPVVSGMIIEAVITGAA